jgi:hypothetical protein
MPRSRAGMLAVALYALPTLAALIYLIWLVLFRPARSALAGVWFVLLTKPWSGLWARMIDALHVDSFMLNLSALSVFAVLNASILYFLVASAERFVNRGRRAA